MAFKFATIFGLICLTSAVVIPSQEYSAAVGAKNEGLSYGYEAQRAPIGPIAPVAPVYNEFVYSNQVAPAAYDFNYEVRDEHTGDIKSQKESRNGDLVQGRYELIDSDGFKRIVEYTADSHNGFNAVVHREPVDFRIPQPIAQEPKLAYAAPIIKDIPVQAQPVNKAVVYGAPKYAVEPKSARYYVTPAYAPASYAPAPSAPVQTAPQQVYSSRVHSQALENAAQVYNAYRFPVQSNPAYTIQGYSAPVYSNPAYSAPAYKAQIYSVPNQKVVSYPAQGYNTHAYATPVHAVQAYSNVQAPQGYYTAPAVQNYFGAPVVTKLAYAAPAPVPAGTYTKQTSNDGVNYYVSGSTANNLHHHQQSGFTPIQVARVQVTPTKVSAYSTPAPVLSSVAPKAEVESNGHSSPSVGEQLKSESGYSSGVTNSYDAYTISSTPSYKH